MGTETTKGAEGTLTTPELLAKIELDLGLLLNPSTIRMWIGRDDNPLPVAYRGKNGQAHRFRWLEFLEWYEAYAGDPQISEVDRTDPTQIDHLDWHNARTISARERAKRDIIETARLAGKYAEVAEMERTAEDRARHAVNLLRTLPARLAPQLAAMTDELAIDQLLDIEIRRICQRIEEAAQTAIGADLEHTDEAAA